MIDHWMSLVYNRESGIWNSFMELMPTSGHSDGVSMLILNNLRRWASFATIHSISRIEPWTSKEHVSNTSLQDACQHGLMHKDFVLFCRVYAELPDVLAMNRSIRNSDCSGFSSSRLGISESSLANDALKYPEVPFLDSSCLMMPLRKPNQKEKSGEMGK